MTASRVPFDVVIHADFRDPVRRVFEVRVLYVLASWTAFAGRAGAWPVTVACIGDPPRTVRWLAEQIGARLSIHPPLTLGPTPYGNKLRGLEAPGEGERIILLDADTLLLADPSPFAELAPGIAAAPVEMPEWWLDEWSRLYADEGEPLPPERISSLVSTVGLRIRPRAAPADLHEQLVSMVPHFNSGVIVAPRHCGLRERWEREWLRAERVLAPQVITDQGPLALAIAALRRQGVPFQLLPEALHTRWRDVYARRVPLRSAVVLHARAFLQIGSPDPAAHRACWYYGAHLGLRMLNAWGRQEPGRRVRSLVTRMAPAMPDLLRLSRVLQRLRAEYVVPALRSVPG